MVAPPDVPSLAIEAQELARSFVHDEIGDDLGSHLVLRILHPWGRWFDPHSCSDLTVLLLDRKGRRGVVMAFHTATEVLVRR